MEILILMQRLGLVGGRNSWDCAFAQNPVSYDAGASYILTFDASASANRPIVIKVGLGDAVQSSIYYTTVNLTTTMTPFSISFTNALSATTTGTLEFQLGGNTADVNLDNVSIAEDGCSDCPNGAENIFPNGDFASGINPWISWGCSPQAVSGEAHLLSIIPGAAEWEAGFGLNNILWENGKTYELSFDASAASARDIYVKMGVQSVSNFVYQAIGLSTNMQSFNFTFTMSDPNTNAGEVFLFLANSDTDVYVDNFVLTNGDCLPDNSCAQNVYIPNPISTGTYEAGLTLTSDATINSPDDVRFHAGDYVELENNFEVGIGASFEAFIQGCN